jgi:acetyl esterase/lipase
MACLLALTALVSGSWAAPVPEGVRTVRDLEYARHDGKPVLLDLYLPKGVEQKVPLVIWVHGGAWAAGSKEGCPAVFLVGRGYAVASINYRLTGEAAFPAQIEDCKAAVRWLRAHAKDYGLDPARFGAWGASAGGHLAALLGTSGGVKSLEGSSGNLKQSSRVQAVCDWFGPADLAAVVDAMPGAFGSRKDIEDILTRLLGGPLRENRAKAAAASPVTYVTKDDPPFLIMHGDQDDTVPIQQSQRLYEALKKAKIEVSFHTVKGAGHGFGGREIMGMVADFFDKHLKNHRGTQK